MQGFSYAAKSSILTGTAAGITLPLLLQAAVLQAEAVQLKYRKATDERYNDR